jgi:four helix bundle protein
MPTVCRHSYFLAQRTHSIAGIEREPTPVMAESMICVRSFEFACRVLDLCDRLWERGPSARHIASQLMRCGTSVGSNAEEAQEGQSKADFIAKLSISSKEARETRWWLRVAVKTKKAKPDEVAWELSEITQLGKMLRSAILTARSSTNRGCSRG